MVNNILVTGGTGFVGAHLVKKLCAKKTNKVTVFSNLPPHKFLEDLDVTHIVGDIRDYDSVIKATRGQNHVYHLAATTINDPQRIKEIFDVNVKGTENVMKACLKAGVKRALYVSSGASLGFITRELPLDEHHDMDFKDNLYAQSKRKGEDKVHDYIAKGLDAVIVNPAYAVGSGEIDNSKFGLWKSISKGRIKFTFPGGGGTVAVEDLADGIILAMERGRTGERYILSNQYVRLYELYNLIAREMGKPRIKFQLPYLSFYPLYLVGLILKKFMKSPPINPESVRWHFRYRMYDSSKAKNELGWKPKISLKQSIRNAIAYYKKIGILE